MDEFAIEYYYFHCHLLYLSTHHYWFYVEKRSQTRSLRPLLRCICLLRSLPLESMELMLLLHTLLEEAGTRALR